jgi:hypothetical protein
MRVSVSPTRIRHVPVLTVRTSPVRCAHEQWESLLQAVDLPPNLTLRISARANVDVGSA